MTPVQVPLERAQVGRSQVPGRNDVLALYRQNQFMLLKMSVF